MIVSYAADGAAARLIATAMTAFTGRWLGGFALAASGACLALIFGGCGGNAATTVRDARVNGTVKVCTAGLARCTPAAAAVTLLAVNGATLGRAVGKDYATDGRFSFLVAPGKYFPAARAARGPHDRRCIAGEVVVDAHETVNDSVSCSVPVRTPVG